MLCIGIRKQEQVASRDPSTLHAGPLLSTPPCWPLTPTHERHMCRFSKGCCLVGRAIIDDDDFEVWVV